MSQSTERGDGPYKGVPLERQLADWRKWPQSERRPEEHPAVTPYHIKPPHDPDVEILADIIIHKTWADRSLVQCNVCMREHKFGTRSGYLASFSDGWWYVVGPDCGDATFQGHLARASNVRKKREAEEKAGADLRHFLSVRPQWLSYWQSLRAPIAEIRALRTAIEDMPDSFTSAIRGAARTDRKLVITVRIQGKSHFETIGRVAGGAFLDTQEAITSTYQRTGRQFGFLLNPGAEEDRIYEEILQQHEKGTLAASVSKLKSQIGQIAALRALVDDAAAFVTPKNLALIQRWSADERSGTAPVLFNDKQELTMEMRGRCSHTISVNSLRGFHTAPPPTRPEE